MYGTKLWIKRIKYRGMYVAYIHGCTEYRVVHVWWQYVLRTRLVVMGSNGGTGMTLRWI